MLEGRARVPIGIARQEEIEVFTAEYTPETIVASVEFANGAHASEDGSVLRS